MDIHQKPAANAPDPSEGPGAPSALRRALGGLPHPGWKRPNISGAQALLVLLALAVAFGGYLFLRGSFRPVEPGFVGIAVIPSPRPSPPAAGERGFPR